MKLLKANKWFGMAALVAAGALAGCGVGDVAPISDVNPVTSTGKMTGTLHGGQQPIQGATVYLYAAGTGGYGSAPQLLAEYNNGGTGTDATGSFSFTKGANGSSTIPNTTSSWGCPDPGTTGLDPQIYLMSAGGNSQTDVNNTTSNSAITLVSVLGPCSKVSGSQFVIVDEFSTTAAAYALAPYISFQSTTFPYDQIGTNGANVTARSQAAVGLNNAVATTANMTETPATYTATPTGSTTPVTVTATVEIQKMNTIADILASCVNTNSATSGNCGQLFAGAVSASGTAPTDIFQAAVYMATNPTNAGTPKGACGTYSSNLACLFALVPGTGVPFQGEGNAQSPLTVAPADWTLGVTYSATGSCANNGFGGALFFDSPTKEAIDANGNIFIVNGSVSKASIVELSPVGVPLGCVIPAQVAGTAQTYGAGITIDPAGNVFGIFAHTTFTNSIAEWAAGATTPVSFSPAAEPYAISSDGDGNIFYETSAAGGVMYEFVAPTTGSVSVGTSTPVVASGQVYPTNATTVIAASGLAADATGHLFMPTASVSSAMIEAYPLASTPTAYSATGTAVTFTGTNSFAVNQTVEISGTGTAFDGTRLVLTGVTGSTFTGASTATGSGTITAANGLTPLARATGASAYQTQLMTGYTTSYGVALDSSNHVYQGSSCCSNGTGGWGKVEKFTPGATFGTASTYSASTTAQQYFGGLNGTRSVAVDGAGHAWLGEYWWESTNSSTSAQVYGLAEVSSTGTGSTATFAALSPTGASPTCAGTAAGGCQVNGGFQKADFVAITDVEIDPSGNVWTVGTGPNVPTSATGTITPYCPVVSGACTTVQPLGTKVVELVGAATPVVTPLSLAAKSGKMATAP